MRISRIHTPLNLSAGTTLQLADETAHYIGKVLRLQRGDVVSLFNGRDGEFQAVIASVDKKTVTVALTDALQGTADPHLPIHLALGISRGERMDYAIQKATEAGVSRITPLLTERCEVKLKGERVDNRMGHWERIAISACEQSGRCSVPVIATPVTLSDFLDQKLEGAAFVLDHRAEAGIHSAAAPAAVTLLIGPEGGLAEEEVSAAKTAGFQSVRLGPRVLRTETAPVIAIAIVQQLWGDYT